MYLHKHVIVKKIKIQLEEQYNSAFIIEIQQVQHTYSGNTGAPICVRSAIATILLFPSCQLKFN